MLATVADRFQALRRDLEDELRACGRASNSASILGVSKKQPASAILEAAAAGLHDIGENYVQEAKEKFALLGEQRAAVQKHYIGHVQTNKAKAIVQLFDVVQTVDRADAATALGKAATAAARVLPVLLQINISPNERFGCPPAEVDRLVDKIRETEGLKLDGIMAIGPVTEDRSEITRAFQLAAKTFARLGGSTLSIGMSGDWREAVRAGSTMIRIGTALFGERQV